MFIMAIVLSYCCADNQLLKKSFILLKLLAKTKFQIPTFQFWEQREVVRY